MDMMSGSQIGSYISATSFLWASSIVLVMIGLVYFIKFRERHDSIENSQFLVLYVLTIILNVLELVMNKVMEQSPSYETIFYKSYILVGFFWNISIVLYVVNYVDKNASKSKLLRITKIFFMLAAILVCIFLGIDKTLAKNGTFDVLTGDLNSVYNLFIILASIVLIIIVFWYRKSMPKGFNLLCLLTFFTYFGIIVFKNVTGYTVKESVFIFSLLILIIFNTTSNQDKESVHKLNEVKDTLAHINDKRNRLINTISSQMGQSLNDLILYNDELYLNQDHNREFIQNDSKEIYNTTNDLLDYLNNVKDIFIIEANYNPINELYQLNSLTNKINSEIIPLVSSKNINFSITVDDQTFLNYVGDLNKIEKAVLNVLYNSVNNTNAGQFINLSIASRQYDLKNVELIFTIKDGSNTTNANIANANIYDFIDGNKIINKYDLKMIISNKLLEILKSKMDIKVDQNNTTYSFTIIQGFRDKELYSSIN